MVVGFATISKAQNGSGKELAVVAGDTISTSGSLDTVSKVIPITAGYTSLGIQVDYKKSSGTTALKAYIYRKIGSTTAANYVLVDSSSAFANSTSWNSVQFAYTAPVGDSYKVQVRGSDGANSTQVVLLRFSYTARKHD